MVRFPCFRQFPHFPLTLKARGNFHFPPFPLSLKAHGNFYFPHPPAPRPPNSESTWKHAFFPHFPPTLKAHGNMFFFPHFPPKLKAHGNMFFLKTFYTALLTSFKRWSWKCRVATAANVFSVSSAQFGDYSEIVRGSYHFLIKEGATQECHGCHHKDILYF